MSRTSMLLARPGAIRLSDYWDRVILTRAFALVSSGERLLGRCIKWAATVSSLGDSIVEGEVADEGERWMVLTGCVFSKGR
jgi:hypothetical protein